MSFNRLTVPGYVYHMLTAVYVDSQVSEFNHIVVGGNGACVTETNGVNKYLFHNPNERTVTLIVLTQSENCIIIEKPDFYFGAFEFKSCVSVERSSL